LRFLRWFDDLVGWVEDGLLAVGMALLAVLLFANVLLRYVFRSPFAWMEEGVVALFVWLVFIGVSACFRSHQHLRIDVLVRFLPRAAALVAGIVAVTATFVILGLLVKLGYDYAHFVSRNVTPVLRISAAWIYVGLPLGMALSLVHLVRQVFDEGPSEVLKSVIETGDFGPGAPIGREAERT
jgi:TRAP-type transport system small permease protein